MHSNWLHKANIDNLTDLWKKYGYRPYASGYGNGFNASLSWPHRYWFDWGYPVDELNNMDKVLTGLPRQAIVPVWPEGAEKTGYLEQQLIANGFVVAFDQAAMCLCLDNEANIANLSDDIEKVTEPQQVDTWAMISGQAFGYEIDAAVIRKVTQDPNIMLMMGYHAGQPASTAMLYQTADIIGVHQVGVVPRFQRQGLANVMMLHVLNQCQVWHGRYVTLQASVAGGVLYQRLGFQSQFTIRNYQRGY